MAQCYAIQGREESLFAHADARYAALKQRLSGRDTATMTHGEVEGLLQEEGRAILRELLQSHLTLRGQEQAVGAVVDAEGQARPHERHDCPRQLGSVFGPVRVERTGHEGPGKPTLFPVDAALNLPPEKHSHGVEREVAEQVAHRPFAAAQAAVEKTTGTPIGKRQVEELAGRAASDFEAFYAGAGARGDVETAADLLVLSFDGKGVVMRREDLREATRQKAEAGCGHKLTKRLSKGEKRNRKRMATVAAVYGVAPLVRVPEDVVRGLRPVHAVGPSPPRPVNKRVWASLAQTPEAVIAQAFAEAQRRDPEHRRRWVVLLDGDRTQLRRVNAEARRRGVEVTIVLDVIHVIEYLWTAAYAFHADGTPEAEAWVSERLLRVLSGEAGQVAAGMRRSATKRGLTVAARRPVERCAEYLRGHAAYLHYDEYLAAGLPIATGVIEGACRHLVKERLEVSGARWSLAGAEAVLKLRALALNGDFDDYWRFHTQREYERHHAARYAHGTPPPITRPTRHEKLRIVQ